MLPDAVRLAFAVADPDTVAAPRLIAPAATDARVASPLARAAGTVNAPSADTVPRTIDVLAT